MLINVSVRRRWVPDLLGNDTQPADQQIIVEYDKPNAISRNAWQRRVVTAKPDGSTHHYTDTDVRAILEGSNVSIVNLAVKTGERKDENGKTVDIISQIANGSTLANTRSDYCYLLATQLAQKIMELEIHKELLKNSEPDSGPA
ncbi:MAG: hypothetical protein EOM68_22685 [Spirochaetia bacterium]|nr:hypothetical protein [Spirochaetia bacterium]